MYQLLKTDSPDGEILPKFQKTLKLSGSCRGKKTIRDETILSAHSIDECFNHFYHHCQKHRRAHLKFYEYSEKIVDNLEEKLMTGNRDLTRKQIAKK